LFAAVAVAKVVVSVPRSNHNWTYTFLNEAHPFDSVTSK